VPRGGPLRVEAVLAQVPDQVVGERLGHRLPDVHFLLGLGPEPVSRIIRGPSPRSSATSAAVTAKSCTMIRSG